jgi:hypothetical protein
LRRGPRGEIPCEILAPIGAAPDFDPLRKNPRFQKLVAGTK